MKTATRFSTDKSDSGIALRTLEGIENRRAWEAILFPIHPKHHGGRDLLGVYSRFTVFLPGTESSPADTDEVLEFGGISYQGTL